MKSIAEKIAQNPYFVIVGWLATVIALLIAIIVPFVQAKKVRLDFSYTSNILVTDKLSEMEGLNISYNGNKINQLAVTSCEIRNTGNVTIEDQSVYDGHKLEITSDSEDVDVLFATVVSQSYDTNNVRISYDDKSVRVLFDALEKNDKTVINIYHSGDEHAVFNIDGKIKEGTIVDTSKPGISIFSILSALALLLLLTLNSMTSLGRLSHFGERFTALLSVTVGFIALILTIISIWSK